MTKNIDNSRVTSVITQSEMLLSNAIKLDDVELIFNEIKAHKCFFEDWYGKQSFEYKLANALLNVVNLIIRSKNDKIGYPKITVSEWGSGIPIRLEWLRQLRVLVNSRQAA
ncbi:hypothetical protein L3081_24200 [Colwellia sp. MSW7]|uniref:Uncharacterized protein n=1 Tax=Colwellia maritima TaxID=2912588 RepID=A0ABS9X6S3_9GAMM|nr:hypothetical protein [Colwellia maritima]MCI2285931.1 hypothetical protein [Colwellia maritima]